VGVRTGWAVAVVALVLAAGCAGRPAAPRGSVQACVQFGVGAIRHHVTVSSRPAACRGLSQAQVNLAVGSAVHAAAGGAGGKAGQRARMVRLSHYLERLVTSVPAPRGQPVVAGAAAHPVSRGALGLSTVGTWLVTVALGLWMLAGWAVRGRLWCGRAGPRLPRQPRQPPESNPTHQQPQQPPDPNPTHQQPRRLPGLGLAHRPSREVPGLGLAHRPSREVPGLGMTHRPSRGVPGLGLAHRPSRRLPGLGMTHRPSRRLPGLGMTHRPSRGVPGLGLAHRPSRRLPGLGMTHRRSWGVPGLNLAHLGLASGGLLAWIGYLASGEIAVGWAACVLLPVVAGLGMALLFLSLAAGEDAPGRARRRSGLVVGAHVVFASVTILLAFVTVIGGG
jgi:hypothetical protein